MDDCLPLGREFTAIACANDLLALGALQRLHERGIRVPGDVSVAGFDDIPVAADDGAQPVHRPPATARDRPARFRRQHYAMLEGQTVEQVTLPTQLVLRDSHPPPRKTA